ncbi:MAG TPA: metal-sulfur cluster assembly factor [Candidatus Hodarchaeales archaeon]|nr:metal-sulfur cluster assembly factor [Candidatus Hodarchaeales archaeon]
MVSEAEVVPVLETIYDPEFHVDIYNLGLIYEVRILDHSVEVDLTFTSPTCPAAGMILYEIKEKLKPFFPNGVRVNIVYEPRWEPSMIKPKGRKKLPPQIISFLDFG